MTQRATPDTPEPGRMRLDKWLWAARFFKTRGAAAEAIDGGRAQVNGERVKRAKLVAPGDRIRIRHGPFEHLLTIRALSERRGPAKEAALLYEEDPVSKRAREDLARQLRAMPAAFHDGKGRPTKKQRRDIERLRRPLALLALLALPAIAVAQDPAAPLPTDPLVTVGTLPNGVRYFVRRNGRPERRLELRLVIQAGSVLEDDDQLGLAHFVEHMAFNGTRHFAKQDLVNYLESIGMRFGPDLNAYTSFDETVYILQVPTDSANIVRQAFRILEDWAHGVAFDSAEIERERGVVIEEWRAGRGSGARIRDQQLPVILKGSRYAERLPIGTTDVLERFSHSALRRFYRDWYRPELMAVVAVGDLDPDSAAALIRAHFAGIPPVDRPRERPEYPVPDHAEPLFAVASDPEATTSNVTVYFKQPLRAIETAGAYRRQVVEQLFLSMLNARLYERSQEADPPFIGAGAGQGRFVGPKEAFTTGATVAEGGVLRGLDAVLTEIERVSRFGFTPVELERAKARRLRGLERSYDERDKTDSWIYADEYVRHVVDAEPIPGIAAELELHRAFLPGVTLDDVNGLGRAWITTANRVVVASGPTKDDVPLPTAEALAEVFGTVIAKDITAYADTLGSVPLVAERPSGSPIMTERRIDEIGVIEWTLANGVRVVLKPTDFKADEIVMQAVSPGGTSLAPDEEAVSADRATMIVSVSGAGAFSDVELGKVLAGKVARATPFIGDEQEGFSGNASPRDLETLFQLVYLYATAARRDSSAFASLNARLTAFVQNRNKSPEAAFGDTLLVTLAQGHPRGRPMTPALIAEADLDEALAFYRDRFADFGDFTFFFVGNLDLEVMRPLVETWLGGLPSAGRQESWRDVGMRPPTGVVRKTVRKGLEPKARTQFVFTGPFADSRENRHAMRSLRDAMQIRLREVLREDMGGVYGVGVGASSDIVPDTTFQVTIGFGTDPAKLDELVAAVFAEVRALQAEGPSDSVVQKVKETQRRSLETSLRENRYWLGQLVAAHRYGSDPHDILTYERLIASLTADDIRRAAQLYLPLDNYVQVTLVPEVPTP
jgi:zinc protease